MKIRKKRPFSGRGRLLGFCGAVFRWGGRGFWGGMECRGRAAEPRGGPSPPPQALPALSPAGERRLRRGGGRRGGCRGGQGGRQAVRRSRTMPPPPAGGGGAGSAPEGRSACRPCACGKGAFGVGAMPAPFGAFARGGSREARGPRPRR